MRRFLLTAAVFAFVPGQLPAQERFSWLDLISPDRIMQQMVQMGIMTLRTQMDMKYGDISVDLKTGRITLTDVKMWPLPPWDTNGDCAIGIDRLTLRTNSLDRVDRLRFKAQISGASAPVVCLPPEAQQGAAMAGIETLDISRATFDVDYGVPGSDAVVRAFAVVEGAAAIDLTVNFAYIWIDGRNNMDNPEPVAFLKNARLTVENRGIWDALKGQLPPPFTDPASAGLAVEGAIGSVIAEMNRGSAGADAGGDPSALSDSQRAFVNSITAAWPAFLADPDTLVLETALTADSYVDFKGMERDPGLAFDTLRPQLALTSSKVADILPVAVLKQAVGPDVATLGEDERRAAGLAMVTGIGAPRDLVQGFALLGPLAKAGDGAAALALSAALESRAPEDAYTWALLAGKTSEAGATARLDRLEDVLDFARVLDLQGAVSGNDTQPPDALQSIAAMREQAAMRLSGNGQARSYASAAMWAMLGKALGDAESADILSDIDEHVRLAGPGAQDAWRPVEQASSQSALAAWTEQDLPARFAR